eukprot:1670843-Rhodomonas_salina.1
MAVPAPDQPLEKRKVRANPVEAEIEPGESGLGSRRLGGCVGAQVLFPDRIAQVRLRLPMVSEHDHFFHVWGQARYQVTLDGLSRLLDNHHLDPQLRQNVSVFRRSCHSRSYHPPLLQRLDHFVVQPLCLFPRTAQQRIQLSLELMLLRGFPEDLYYLVGLRELAHVAF